MRTVFVVSSLIVVALVTFIFVKEGLSAVLTGQKGNGMLTVMIPNTVASISIDGEEYQTTPRTRIQVPVGERLISVGEGWQTKIQVAEGTESIVNRLLFASGTISFGYQIGYESSLALFAQNTLTVITTPQDAKITINGAVRESSPVIYTSEDNEDYEVTVSRDSYKEETITIANVARTRSQLVVDLQPLVFESMTPVVIPSTVSTPTQSTMPVPSFVSRVEFGGAMLLGDSASIVPWEHVVAFQIDQFAGLTPEDTVRVLDELSQELYGYNGIPFAYVITEDGTLFEGNGIYHYDFSSYGDRGFNPGEVPVLVVASEVTDLILSRLHDVVYLAKTPPPPRARNISEIETLSLALGEERNIALQFQNTGSVAWEKVGRFVLKTVGNADISEFYNPVSWRSVNEVVSIDATPVYPGEDTTVSLSIQAPYYPSTITQSFVLVDSMSGVEVLGSKITVSAEVSGDVTGTLRIGDTPTGYLNVRSGPNIGSNLVTSVFPGEKFAFREQDGEWIQIILRDGVPGWISRTYVEIL